MRCAIAPALRLTDAIHEAAPRCGRGRGAGSRGHLAPGRACCNRHPEVTVGRLASFSSPNSAVTAIQIGPAPSQRPRRLETVSPCRRSYLNCCRSPIVADHSSRVARISASTASPPGRPRRWAHRVQRGACRRSGRVCHHLVTHLHGETLYARSSARRCLLALYQPVHPRGCPHR